MLLLQKIFYIKIFFKQKTIMSIENLKKVNLQQIQKPKTLIVIHYKNKRVSIPIFESIDNITQYLWHQLHKFQTTILDKQQKIKYSKTYHDINNILGFTSFEPHDHHVDLKMNIILSMSRLYRDAGESRSDIKLLDITTYYKYLQIQPYYAWNHENQLTPDASDYCTIYMGRKVSDGRFCSIKVSRSDIKLSQNEYNSMKILHHQQSKFDHKDDLQIIPQIMEVRKVEGLYIYVYQYCPGGTLRNALKKKIKEIECLHYMKQLVWGIHTLHTKFNLIYRALCFENIEVDFVGNLRLVNFAYCQPCFSSNYSMNYNVPESYQQKYQIPNVIIPPEVQRSSKYNNLVDYYGIGVVLSQMFAQQEQTKQFFIKKQKQGIEIAIDNFMAENIKQRQLFCTEVIAELQQQKINRQSQSKISQNLQHERLTLNKIYTGQNINKQQKSLNGIKHDQVQKLLRNPSNLYHLLNPPIKTKSKSKQKTKSVSKNTSQSKGKNKSTLQQSNQKHFTNQHNKSKIQNHSKVLNKSIDSKGNSVKSSKSKTNNQKSKSKSKISQHRSPQLHKNLIPKNHQTTSIKSPSKMSYHKQNDTTLNTPFYYPNKTKIKY